MQANPKKVKLIIFLAITLVVVLLVSCIALLVSVSSKKQQIAQQQTEIVKLENQIKYYNQQDNTQTPDNNIVTEE